MGSYLSSYLRASWRAIACFAALMLSMHAVLYLSVPLRAVWSEVLYLDLLLCAMALGFLCYGFAHYRSRHRQLFEALQSGAPLLPTLAAAPSAEDVRILSACIRAEARRSGEDHTTLLLALREQQDALTSWAHEVKTPLSVMRLILSREEAAPVERDLGAQLDRVESQLRGVLHQERLRHLDQSIGMTGLDVPGLLRAAIARSAPLMQGRSLEVALDAPAVEAMGDEQCAAYILDQLLTNAAKYAPEGSTVRVCARQARQAAALSIINLGEIGASQIGRVFDKGFSGGGERASGMGLYYARQTAVALGGALQVNSEAGETCFTLSLPRFQTYLAPASH